MLCAQSHPALCNPLDCSLPGSCLWDFPGKNTGVDCHFLFQGIFPIQGSNLHLLHCQVDSLPLSHWGIFTKSKICTAIHTLLIRLLITGWATSKINQGTSLGGPVAKHSNAGEPGSIPGQETRSHVPQLKITHAAMKTDNSTCRNKDLAQPSK